MRGSDKVIDYLNFLLADELTAINEYMVHSEMFDNWGYERLHDATEARAMDEMRHAESLIARIIFLDGRPIVSKLNDIHIGAEAKSMIENDLGAEVGAIKAYNEGIALSVEQDDNGTRELLEATLKDEEDHLDWLEAQLDQIAQMGIENYLSQQLGAPEN